MKSRPNPRPRSIADAVYVAIQDVDGGSEEQVMKRASKLCGRPVTKAQFKRALTSFDKRAVGWTRYGKEGRAKVECQT
jgi:hypothetical protein